MMKGPRTQMMKKIMCKPLLCHKMMNKKNSLRETMIACKMKARRGTGPSRNKKESAGKVSLLSQSVNQSVSQPVSQSVSQSNSQSVNQSISH